MAKSPRVDAYLAKAPKFARPILEKIRGLYHRACPQIEETMKWGVPNFEHKGIVGNVAAFTKHVSVRFWKGSLLRDPHRLFQNAGNTAMHSFKVADVADLPADRIVLEYIREAVALNDQGVKVPATKKKVKKELIVPDYFLAALKKNRKAHATFESFSPSHKREYVEWITEAKQETTRAKRLATALEWLAEGKPRNWKYQNC